MSQQPPLKSVPSPVVQAKHLLLSKTFWWNVLNAGFYLAHSLGYVQQAPSADTQLYLNALGNLILRLYTKQPVTLK